MIGAAVFLYNPCSVKEEVDAFKQIAKSCMKKHIITPYKNLPKGEIFNVVTYGCRLALTKVTGSEKAIYEFLKVQFPILIPVKSKYFLFQFNFIDKEKCKQRTGKRFDRRKIQFWVGAKSQDHTGTR